MWILCKIPRKAIKSAAITLEVKKKYSHGSNSTSATTRISIRASTPLIRLTALAAIALLTGCGPGVRVGGNGAPDRPAAFDEPKRRHSPSFSPARRPSSVAAGADYSFQPTVLQGSGPHHVHHRGQAGVGERSIRRRERLSGIANGRRCGAGPRHDYDHRQQWHEHRFDRPIHDRGEPRSPDHARAAAGRRFSAFNWSAPTGDTDGMPVTDLAGYRIHYGDQRVRVDANHPGQRRRHDDLRRQRLESRNLLLRRERLQLVGE